ncbi:MAG TPA: hypothetical protein VNL77_18990 [Roseiflexaceae bacterium]|nr:hypothetical protein [Roseiflexaceae bacterium]
MTTRCWSGYWTCSPTASTARYSHYNIHGFYAEWFATTRDCVRFICFTLGMAEDGTPFCFPYDATERAIQGWVRRSQLLTFWQARLDQEILAAKRAMLTELKAELEPEAPPALIAPTPALLPRLAPTLAAPAAPARRQRRATQIATEGQMRFDLFA